MSEDKIKEAFGRVPEEVADALQNLPDPAPVQVFSSRSLAEAERAEDALRNVRVDCFLQRASGQNSVLVSPSDASQALRALQRKEGSPNKKLPRDMPRVLGLVGFLRAGKDEVAAYLEENYLGVFRMAYSDPIIAECNLFLQGTGHAIVEANKDVYRLLLQSWSMARRAGSENYWSEILRDDVERALEEHELVVLSGARLPADVELVRLYRGELWRVVRPGGRRSEHPNEAWIERIDCQQTIWNDAEGDLQRVHEQVEKILWSGS